MKDDLTVTVTDADIAEGQRCSGLHCPVALALERATHQDWHVADDHLSPCIGDEYESRHVPKEVKRFIRRFDAMESVKPFSFVLSCGKRYVLGHASEGRPT